MGKAKKKSRNSKARSNGPDYKASHANDQDEKLRTQKILPVMQNLVASDMTDRSMAISAINVMCEDPKLRTLLLKEKLLKVVLENSIKDSSEEIVSEAYGLLRNLCIEEGYDVAVFLWRQDILTLIENDLNKSTKAFEAIASGKSDDAKFTKQQVTTVFEFTENILGLISSLASSSENIFNAVSERLSQGLGKFLTSVIAFARSTIESKSSIAVTSSLFTAVCEVLYTLSEDNAKFIESVAGYPFQEILNEFSEGKTYYPSPSLVYLNGLKYNLLMHELSSKRNNNNDDETNDTASTNSILTDIQISLANVIKSIDTEKALSDMAPLSSEASMAEVNAQFQKSIHARSLIESVQVAIEIITALAETVSVDPTNIAEAEEPTEEIIEEEDEAMMIENDDDELYIRKAVQTHDNDAVDTSVFNGESTEDDWEPVLAYLNNTSLPLVSQFLDIPEFQSRAMAALNNISWSIHGKASNHKQWKQSAEELWTKILPRVTANDQTKYTEIEVLNSATGVLWAVASTFKGQVPISSEALSVLISQTTSFASLYPAEECAEYCSKAVGLLAQLAKAPGKHDITVAVSQFLFDTLSTAQATSVKDARPIQSPKVVIEIIYAIFEVFGDASYDYDMSVYVQGGLNAKLAAMLSPLRKYFKRVDRIKEPLLRARGDECVLNLARFIDYKKQERL